MRCRKARAGTSPDAWAAVSPGGQVLAALAVLLPVTLSGLALVVFAPPFWWIFTTYFWVSFPALGLLARGLLAGLSKRGGLPPTEAIGEREVLEALHGYGELTPTRAAMETSLTVAGANEVLRGLAEGGHLRVRVRGATLSYALWELPQGESQQRAAAFRGQYAQPLPKLPEPGGEVAARQGSER